MDEEYCGNYPSTSTPTAGIDAAFDSDAHINSEDMSSQDVEDFLADINAQGTPSEYRKLLWTNASPSTTFAAQTISLDLSDYEEVEVEYVDHNVHISTMSQIRVKIGQSGSMNIMIGNSSYSSGVPFVANRRFSVTQTGITFGDGAGTPVSSSLATRNDSCIPYRIYGIKYEKVAPIQIDSSVEVLAPNVILHRVGNARMLNIGSATYQTIKSITLSADDRPSARVESMGMKHAGGMYATIGLLYIETTGKIVCNHFGGYSTAAYSSALVDSDAFIGNAIWSV